MPLFPWSEQELFPTHEACLWIKAVQHISGDETYADLYEEGLVEDPRCLEDGLDGFGTPY